MNVETESLDGHRDSSAPWAGERYAITEFFPEGSRAAYLELAASALRMFSEFGFERTKTRDISAGAGLSAGAMYVHFESKETILYEISHAAHLAVTALVDDVIAEGGAARDRMRNLLERFVEWHAENAMAARVIYREWSLLGAGHREVIVRLRADIQRKTRSILDLGCDSGEFVVGNREIALYAVLSLGIDVARWYSEAPKFSVEEMSREYATLGLRMLNASPDEGPGSDPAV